MFPQKLGKFRGNIVGMDQFSNLVDIDITDVILHIGAFEEFALVFLLFLQGQQLFAEERNQRQSSQAGLVLGFVFCVAADLSFALSPVGCYRVGDGEGVVLKIEVVPLKPYDLAAAQAIEQAEVNGKFQFGPFSQAHTLQSLLRRVETADEFLGGRPLMVGCIMADQIVLHRTFQCRMDIGMVAGNSGPFFAGNAVPSGRTLSDLLPPARPE